MENDAPTFKSIHVELPVELHRRLKVLGAIQGRSMKSFCEEAVAEKIARDEKVMMEGRKS